MTGRRAAATRSLDLKILAMKCYEHEYLQNEYQAEWNVSEEGYDKVQEEPRLGQLSFVVSKHSSAATTAAAVGRSAGRAALQRSISCATSAGQS